jgi:hypothetical protein
MSAAVPGIDPATALQVRRAIYAHDPLTRADMDLVFATARKAGPAPCAEWASLFSEAVTDYVVHQNEPADYIPQVKADWLVQTLTDNGGIASRAEFGMLIDVMTHALGVPASLSSFALREIKTAIVEGRCGAITGEDHPAGVVTRADVEALRAVLYAATTGTAEHITREEAEALFDIAHAAKQADPAFDDLFARAVGNYLMAIKVHVPDAAEALHFDKWLDETDTLPGFLSRMLKGAPAGESPGFESDLAKQDAADAAARAESEKVTDAEASWVIAHLTRDGGLTAAETRLLQFLGAEATSVAPALRPLIDRAKAAAA